MVMKIDSQALSKVNDALGISGAGAGETDLMDSTVEQVLDVGAIVRRSQTLAGTQGIFRGLLRNVHAAQDTQSSGIDPYNPSGLEALTTAPYPDPMPDRFDLWLLGVSLTRFSATGSTDGARLQITNIALAWAVDQDDAVVTTANVPIILAHWDKLATNNSPAIGLNQSEDVFTPLRLRMPRDGMVNSKPTLQFLSSSTAAVTLDCNLLLGVFATALGQDAIY